MVDVDGFRPHQLDSEAGGVGGGSPRGASTKAVSPWDEADHPDLSSSHPPSGHWFWQRYLNTYCLQWMAFKVIKSMNI